MVLRNLRLIFYEHIARMNREYLAASVTKE